MPEARFTLPPVSAQPPLSKHDPAAPPDTTAPGHALALEMLSRMPEALLWIGSDGRLRWLNDAAQALLGPSVGPGCLVDALFATFDDGSGLRVLVTPDHGTRAVRVQPQALSDGSCLLGLRLEDACDPGVAELESQLALATELGGIAIWRHDLVTQRMHYNAQAYAVLDLAPRPEGLSIDEVRALIHPEDMPTVIASAQVAMTQPGHTDMEARYRRRDGSWRNVLTRRVVQRDASGRPLAFVGVALDVTDRMETLRRSTELSQRFELVTRTAGIGYWVLEPGARQAQWSLEMRRLFGLAEGAPVPSMHDWLTLHVHPQDQHAVRRLMRDWMQGPELTLEWEFRIQLPGGGVRQVRTQSRKESVGATPLAFGVVVDVTELRDVSLALQSAHERAALVAEGVGLGTWEIDFAADTVHWDPQMWRLRGHTPLPRPMNPEERDAVTHPDDRDRMRGRFAEQRVGEVAVDTDFRVIWPDGSVHWLASRAVTVRDERGQPIKRLGVNWDVTDARMNATVRQQRELAQRESQAKSRFLARMSHELRTPLNAVLGFTQLLQVEDVGADAAAASRRRRLAHVHSAGQHLLSLINDVLDLSSLESGELRIAAQEVPLAALVAETLPLLAPLLQGRRLQLRTGTLQGTALGDPTRLRQVLLNLLSNAVKYNREGGEVRLDTLTDGAEVRLRVADTGRGLDPEQLQHLFEPFNRLGREADGIEGTGIGLAIVKTLVERMDGRITVESRPGEGSVFEVWLPAAQVGAADAPEDGAAAEMSAPGPAQAGAAARGDGATTDSVDASAAAAGSGARGTLLYIEDNPINALIIRELVARRSDLVLHVAVDGLSGVRDALALRPDLILLDMQLPDIDGHEVLRRLRAQPETAAIACIALSANAMPEDISRALAAGMSDYWTKPLDFRAFMASLDALFGKPA